MTLSTAQLLKFDPRRSWKHLTPHERLALIAKTVLLADAYAFSLNLSHGRIAAFHRSDDPKKQLADEINRLCKKHLGRAVEVLFTFEYDEDDRLHVHGIAILANHDRQTKAIFRQILKQAGGVIHGAATNYQVKLKLIVSDGWRRYVQKDIDRTVELLGTDKISYSSRSITRLAKEAHEIDLARQKTASRNKGKPMTPKSAIETQGRAPASISRDTSSRRLNDSHEASTAVYESIPDDWLIDLADLPALSGGISLDAMAEVERLLDDL